MKRKGSKKTTDLQSLLRSRNALYLVLFFAVMNLFSYLMMKQLDAVAFFIIVGFLTTYFSKNMIIVMLTAMVSTFFLVQIRLLGNNRMEGMETMDASGNKITTDASGNKLKTDASGNVIEGNENMEEEEEESPISTSDIQIDAKTREKFTTSKGELETPPKKEAFAQQLNPARYNANDDDDTPRHKPKVDYSATLESAYDNLDKLLSSDAIRNMTADTSRLAEKQQKLMGNIEKLTPIMDKASSVLSGLDIGGMSGLMNGIQERLKGFGMKGDAEPEGMEVAEGAKGAKGAKGAEGFYNRK